MPGTETICLYTQFNTVPRSKLIDPNQLYHHKFFIYFSDNNITIRGF